MRFFVFIFIQTLKIDMTKNNHKKMCIILHLYYIDLWGYFLPYLKMVGEDIDLYVTITEGHSEGFTNIHNTIISEFPKSHIYLLPNRGMDIAPFIYVMNEIVLSGRTYDAIIKLHSKKSLKHLNNIGDSWRTQLTDALLGSVSKLQNNFYTCIKTNQTMVGCSQWVINQKYWGFEQEYFSEKITFSEYEFVGGTMFMVKFDLIMNWFVSENIYKRFYDKFDDGYIVNDTIAHHFERLFGCLVKLKGNNILKV